MRHRFPEWIKRRIPSGGSPVVKETLDELGLATVCQSARCPNIHECFAAGTATFLIMGKVCTRGCRFCAIPGGEPEALDAGEPARIAEAAARLGLRHVVVTSVTRDDLDDGGSGHFAAVARAIKAKTDATVEVLVPDFRGDRDCIRRVLESGVDIFNHNIETVERLYADVRPGADYARSLAVLRAARESDPGRFTKSGIMVGLGETGDEVFEVMVDLRAAGCDIITIGQYLKPSAAHLPVAEFVHPDRFEKYGRAAKGLGFRSVTSGPFVRSSYHAAEVFFAAGING